jgi:hypothetical protein
VAVEAEANRQGRRAWKTHQNGVEDELVRFVKGVDRVIKGLHAHPNVLYTKCGVKETLPTQVFILSGQSRADDP